MGATETSTLIKYGTGEPSINPDPSGIKISLFLKNSKLKESSPLDLRAVEASILLKYGTGELCITSDLSVSKVGLSPLKSTLFEENAFFEDSPIKNNPFLECG